jgi:hypothetical protein
LLCMYFKNLLRIQVIGSDWLAQAGDFAQWSGFFPSVRIVGLMSYSKHAQVQRETCGSRQTFPCWRKNHPLWAKHKASRDTRAPLPPVLIFVCSNWDFARVHGNPSLRRFAAAGWICRWHPRAVSKRSFSPASRRKPTIMQLGEIYGWNLLIWKWPATTLKKKHGGNPKQNPKTEMMEVMEPIYDEADANWSTWWPGGLLKPGLVMLTVCYWKLP